MKRKRNRRSGSSATLTGRRFLVPVPSAFWPAAGATCALLVALTVIWGTTGGTAQAVTTSTTADTTATSSTTTTEFALQGIAKTQFDELTAQAKAVQAQIDALNEELLQRTEEYNKCLADLEEANLSMATLRRTIAGAQAEKAELESRLAARLTAVYKSGGRDQLLQLLLTSRGLEDFYKRVQAVSTIAEQDRRLVADLKAISGRLSLLTTALDNNKSDQVKLRKALATRLQQIEETNARQQQTLAALDQRVREVVAQEQARQKAEQERLKAELEARLAAERAAALAAAQAAARARQETLPGDLPWTDNAVTNQLIETAVAYLGVPYVWGGSKPSTGMDCSGFTRYVFKQHGINLPHYSGYQAKMGRAVDPTDMQQGDLLAFGSPVHHVGIYIGDGLYIDTPGDYVKIHKLTRTDISAIRRFPVEMRSGMPLSE